MNKEKEDKKKNAFGMIGLGTMGSNLLQNIADQGFSCVGYDIDAAKVTALTLLERDSIQAFPDLKEFVDSLEIPRKIMLLVPAGKIVDVVIEDLLEILDKGDIIIDGGNSHFTDTNRRFKVLEEKGVHFIGMGVSGGEEGARHGPSMMPGGDKEAYEQIKPILEKVAANVNGDPTVDYMGEGSAGHFVKMVHNGIEYALMQLIAESYEILSKGVELKDKEIHELFKNWNEGRLQSFLMEITRDIFAFKNPEASHLLLHDIKDEAKSKGTGKWTSQVAMDLNLPIPIIDISVSMRDLSKFKTLRTEASKEFTDSAKNSFDQDRDEFISQVEQAFYFAMVSAYAQGMHLLHKASTEFGYKLELGTIAKIWRGGCIIRASFLEDIYAAYQKNPDLEHLFLDENIRKEMTGSLAGSRKIVSYAAAHGYALPAFSASLSYFDAFRSEHMPANLIQAQRDYFGAHTYELIGKEGIFHTEWQSSES